MESTAHPTHQIDTKNKLMANAWNCQTHSPNIDREIVSENWVTVEREIIFENWVMSDRWNRQRIRIHDSQMKSIEKTEPSMTHVIASETASLITRNRQQKHSRYRPWNHNWNLSDSWSMESTARLMHQIDTKNRFMANAWNCQTHSPNVDPQIVSENWVTAEREIIFEIWVTADGWNQQRILIPVWSMTSIEKTESSLMHGIVSENYISTNQKSSAKT